MKGGRSAAPTINIYAFPHQSIQHVPLGYTVADVLMSSQLNVRKG